MKLIPLLPVLTLFALGAGPAAASDGDGNGSGNFTGTYIASLPQRAEILQLHQNGTALITLSDEVTSGAGGFTFSDSLGSWKVAGPRKLTARFLNLNFDVSGPPAFSGTTLNRCQGLVASCPLYTSLNQRKGDSPEGGLCPAWRFNAR